MPLLHINMLPFCRLRKWGWGQLCVGMGGNGDSHMRGWMGSDGDDLETNVGIGVGMGIIFPGTVGNGYKYLSPCSCLVRAFVCTDTYV